jgi:streptogramin lyase
VRDYTSFDSNEETFRSKVRRDSIHDVKQPPSTLKAFDLQTGALKEKYPLPTDGAFRNDIAVGSDGTTYISDTNNMEVDRFAPGGHQLEVWAGNGGFGPRGFRTSNYGR